MAPLPTAAAPSNHYAVLGLPKTPAVLRKADVKLAYHRALLKHHPDKSSSATPHDDRQQQQQPSSSSSSSSLSGSSKLRSSADSFRGNGIYTVDEIMAAYKILSDPAARAEYDRSLLLSGSDPAFDAEERTGGGDYSFRTGLEIFDLDDMHQGEVTQTQTQGKGHGLGAEAEEHTTTWYRSCRCGDEKGFLVREEDLEREAERGEVLVGCRGCSLWAKVLFALDEG